MATQMLKNLSQTIRDVTSALTFSLNTGLQHPIGLSGVPGAQTEALPIVAGSNEYAEVVDFDGGQAFKLKVEVSTITAVFQFRLDVVKTCTVRVKASTPSNAADGTQVNTLTTVANADINHTATYNDANLPAGSYMWLEVPGAANYTGNTNNEGARISSATLAEGSLSLTDSNDYQLWNNGPADVMVALHGTQPGAVTDGTRVKEGARFPFTKASAEKVWMWLTDDSWAHVSVVEA